MEGDSLSKLMGTSVYIDALASSTGSFKRFKNLRKIISSGVRSRHSFNELKSEILRHSHGRKDLETQPPSEQLLETLVKTREFKLKSSFKKLNVPTKEGTEIRRLNLRS